jgi:hypothetical protein
MEVSAMARQYSLRAFLRQAPQDMLKRYLAEKGLGEQIKWLFVNPALKEQDIDSFIQLLGDEGREATTDRRTEIRRIYRDFSQIFALGDARGYELMVELGRDRKDKDLLEVFTTFRSDLQRAFWFFFECPDLFPTAVFFHHCDTSGGWRKRRSHLRGLKPDLSSDSVHALEQEIAHHFTRWEAKGESCTIIRESRTDGRHYWFASPADAWQTIENVDEDGNHDTLIIRPTFEVVFVYNPREYSLAIRGPRKKKHITAMQQLFGRAVLHRELPEDDPEDVYQLNRLVEPGFEFSRPPDCHVTSARLKTIRYRVRDSVFPRVTLEVADGTSTGRIFDDLSRHLESDDASVCDIEVDYALIQVTFDNSSPAYKGQLSFYISGARTCSLKYDERDLMIHKLLKVWGIDVSEDVDDDTDSDGSATLQCVL